MIDSGGQPEYVHMLPAINNSPTINFVVLDMTKNLDDQSLYSTKANIIKISQIILYITLIWI